MRIGWGIPLPGPFYVGGTIWRSGRRRRRGSRRPGSGCGCLPWLAGACALGFAIEHPWLWPPIGVLVLWALGAAIVRRRRPGPRTTRW